MYSIVLLIHITKVRALIHQGFRCMEHEEKPKFFRKNSASLH